MDIVFVESMDQGMRDLSEALPLVEQAEAALDVLDKKDRGTGGEAAWYIWLETVCKGRATSYFPKCVQNSRSTNVTTATYNISNIWYITTMFYLLPPETSTTLPGI